jgi:hypothetical protein
MISITRLGRPSRRAIVDSVVNTRRANLYLIVICSFHPDSAGRPCKAELIRQRAVAIFDLKRHCLALG